MESDGWEMMPSIAEAYNAAESFGDRVVSRRSGPGLRDRVRKAEGWDRNRTGGGGVASEGGTKNGSGVVLAGRTGGPFFGARVRGTYDGACASSGRRASLALLRLASDQRTDGVPSHPWALGG